MGMLFDCTVDNIWLHLKNIYESGELQKEATFEEISVVRREGNRDVPIAVWHILGGWLNVILLAAKHNQRDSERSSRRQVSRKHITNAP